MKYLVSCLLLGLMSLCVLAWHLTSSESLLHNVPFGGLVLDSSGGILRMGLAADDKYRLRVGLEGICPEAVSAVLEYEDRYFFTHPGFNPVALGRALISLFHGRRMGGSTITMQVARLRYGLKTSGIAGKALQIVYAIGLEMRHSKQEILEAYFNLAPYGGNIEGIEAASRIYFHKGALQLTPLESRALAVIPQNPVRRNPVTGKDFEKARQRFCPPEFIQGKLQVFAPADLPFLAPHLTTQILKEKPGGVSETGVEKHFQMLVENKLAEFVLRESAYGLTNAAAILVRASDMRIVALAGSANYFDANIQGMIDGTKARRSPGSTLKPFIYALALDQGLIHPETILPDTPKSFGGYDPENFERGFGGPVAAGNALRSSRNLPAIGLAGRLSSPDLYGFLQNADIKFDKGPEHYGLALALGGAEISMRDIAALYAMLANGGVWQPLSLNAHAELIGKRRLLSPESAWLTLHMLKRPEAIVQGKNGQCPIYYKTGTSNGLRDAWTAGIVGEYVLVVWVGNFDNSPNPYLVGAQTALPLFENIISSLAHKVRLTCPSDSPPSHLNLAQVEVCQATGDLYKGQCAERIETWIIPGVTSVKDTGILRKILIDKDTGLRACVPEHGRTEIAWWEFWPSDMEKIFAKAGIHKKKPPAWLPQCEEFFQHASGAAPRILLPKKNVTYHRRLNSPDWKLPLQAAADADVRLLHWYAGAEYLGSAKPGEIIYWNAPPGSRQIMAVDDAGRSVSQRCVISVIQ